VVSFFYREEMSGGTRGQTSHPMRPGVAEVNLSPKQRNARPGVVTGSRSCARFHAGFEKPFSIGGR